jgi:DNA polymerase III subunit gamma/tau
MPAMPSRSVPAAPPPWDEEGESAVVTAAAANTATANAVTASPLAAAQKKTEEPVLNGIAAAEPQASAAVPQRAKPRLATAVPELNWDGNWPALAAALPLRGVVQQLAQQSELMGIEFLGEAAQFHLRIPLETLRSAGSVDKLANALSDYFGKTMRVTTEIGAVEQTANAQAVAEREERQRRAEQDMQQDPFVQTMMREFGATIVPGSVKPA